MTLKRYQVAILFFALGIAAITFSLNWFVALKEQTVEVSEETGKEYSSLQIFFSNSVRDPDSLDCSTTYPAVREVSRPTNNPESRLGEWAYIAIKELLKGPTEMEKKSGFFTSVNPGSKVREIDIIDGVATIDFNQTFNEAAGSCRVQAIRSQVSETLKQFPEIKEVVISVEGRVEEVLQP
jgi:hypothetical protein